VSVPSTEIGAADRRAIKDLIHTYYWLADHGPMRALVDLYADDGRLIGVGRLITGHAALRLEVDRQPADLVTRHSSSSLRMQRLQDGSVQVAEVLTLYRNPAGERPTTTPAVIADVIWILRPDPEKRWRVLIRYVERVFH
jgi:hypothetical protein